MKRLKLTAAAEVRAAELAEAHLNNNIAFVHVLSVTWVHAMPRFPLTDCSLSGSHMPAFKVDNKVWSVTLPAQLLWIHFIIKVNTSLVFPSKIFFHVWRMTWHFHLSNYSVIYLTTLHLNNWHKALFSFGGGEKFSSPQVLNRILHQVNIRSFSEALCRWKCVMVYFPSWSWHSSNSRRLSEPMLKENMSQKIAVGFRLNFKCISKWKKVLSGTCFEYLFPTDP